MKEVNPHYIPHIKSTQNGLNAYMEELQKKAQENLRCDLHHLIKQWLLRTDIRGTHTAQRETVRLQGWRNASVGKSIYCS